MVNEKLFTKIERDTDGKEYFTIEDKNERDICDLLSDLGSDGCYLFSEKGECEHCLINQMVERLGQLEHKEVPSLIEKFRTLDEYRRCWNCDFFEGQPGYRCFNRKSSYFGTMVGDKNYCGKFCPQRMFNQIVEELLSREEKQG